MIAAVTARAAHMGLTTVAGPNEAAPAQTDRAASGYYAEFTAEIDAEIDANLEATDRELAPWEAQQRLFADLEP